MASLGVKSPVRPSSSPRAAFQLASSSSSPSSATASDDEDDTPLPFPEALPRTDFLAPDFHPATYLSDLPYRHQTLDDLKSDLRERSAAISAELLELVNANYTSFLSLGDDLRGGDDKVEGVKVAMLGFRRQVEEIKGRVRSRKDEVGGLTSELASVRGDIEAGRRMLELDDRVAALEEQLTVASLLPGKSKSATPAGANDPGNHDEGGDDKEDDGDDWSLASTSDESDGEDDDDGDDDNYTGFMGTSPAKLSSLAREYGIIEALADAVGPDTPFVIKMESRMVKCRNTLLLDLNTALREARKSGDKGKGRVVKYLGLYAMLDAQAEAVKALKGS